MSDPEGSVDAEGDSALASRSERMRRDRRRRGWRRFGIGLASVVVLALVLGVGAWIHLNGNIERVDLGQGMGVRPTNSSTVDPATDLTALNILVIGSDSRANGESGNGNNSGIEGQRSDTNLIVHLAADRKSAIVVSIPRDSMTKAPNDCDDPASVSADGAVRQWNDNYYRGGEACTAKTFEGLTGIRIDHSVSVDFVGFKTMVEALGGVEICTPEPIDDPDAHLVLEAGRQRLNGDQALGYVRARETLGDGSDIGRIARQQVFLSSMIQEATNSKLLLRPDRLYRFLNAATSSMTADEGLTLGTMTDIAQSISSIGIDNINFLTVPIEAYPPDANRVQWAPSSEALWEAIRLDQPLPGTEPVPTTTPSTPVPTTPVLTVSPDDVTVRIVNDSGAEGLAVQAAAALRPQGFVVAGLSNGAGTGSQGVVIRHTAEQTEAAKTVAAAFPGATLTLVTTPQSSIEVILGAKAASVVAVPNRLGTDPLPQQPITAPPAAASSTPSFTARSADTDICA